jgi:hypothetical protein
MKPLQLIAVALILLAAAALRWQGLDRSLWLDEAWVANSVLETSIPQMLYFDRWLQTSPPIFLFAVRLNVAVFGPGNAAFRLAPWIFSVWACVMTALAIRAFTPSRKLPILPVALCVVALYVPAIEYGAVLKQYSSDIAVAATLLWTGLRHRAWLPIALPIAILTSYPAIFLAPGLIFLAPRRLLTATSAAAAFLVLYFALIQPNSAESLRSHWAAQPHGYRHLFYLQSLLPYAVAAIGLSILTRRRRRYLAVALIYSPVFLLLAADRLGAYPASARTALFILPCLALALAGATWAVALRSRALAYIVLLMAFAAQLSLAYRDFWVPEPVEEMDEAVTEIYARAQASDKIYVHASAAEGFRLYAKLRDLSTANVLWGATSWPCCPRHLPFAPGRTNDASVAAGLARLFPSQPNSRVWLIWTNRPEHWVWVGHDDRQRILDHLEGFGCIRRTLPTYRNVGLFLYSCGP